MCAAARRADMAGDRCRRMMKGARTHSYFKCVTLLFVLSLGCRHGTLPESAPQRDATAALAPHMPRRCMTLHARVRGCASRRVRSRSCPAYARLMMPASGGVVRQPCRAMSPMSVRGNAH